MPPEPKSDRNTPYRGPQLTGLNVADEPEAWRAAGFDVDDGGACRLGLVTVRLMGRGHKDAAVGGATSSSGVISWSFHGVDPGLSDIDGLALGNEPPPPGSSSTTHPNGVTSIDHVVVSSGNCARTTAALNAAGFPTRRGLTATSKETITAHGFFWAGDVILELIGLDGESDRSEDPTSIFGLALVSPDLDATSQLLGELLGTPKNAVQPGRRIAGLRGRAVGMSVPVAVMSPHPAT